MGAPPPAPAAPPPLRPAARVVAAVALVVAFAVAGGGLAALITSHRAPATDQDSSKLLAVRGRGPLDAGLVVVQALRAPVGATVTFRLGLDNDGRTPIVLRSASVVSLDPLLEVRSITALDQQHAGRVIPVDGATLAPLHPVPDSQVGGLVIRVAATAPGRASAVGLRVTYDVGGQRRTDVVWDAWGVCSDGRGGVCRPMPLRRLEERAAAGS